MLYLLKVQFLKVAIKNPDISRFDDLKLEKISQDFEYSGDKSDNLFVDSW